MSAYNPNLFPHLSCCLFFTLSFSTFNPADYTTNSGARQETWEGDGNDPAEGTGKENNRTSDVIMPFTVFVFHYFNCEMACLSASKYQRCLAFACPKLRRISKFRLLGAK